jgi:hypothetical protein
LACPNDVARPAGPDRVGKPFEGGGALYVRGLALACGLAAAAGLSSRPAWSAVDRAGGYAGEHADNSAAHPAAGAHADCPCWWNGIPCRCADGGGGRVDQPAAAYAHRGHGLGAAGVSAYGGGRRVVVPDIDFPERDAPSPKSSAQAVTIWAAGTRVDDNVGVHCWASSACRASPRFPDSEVGSDVYLYRLVCPARVPLTAYRSSALTLMTRRCPGIGRSSGLCPRITTSSAADWRPNQMISCPIPGWTENRGRRRNRRAG